MNIESTQRYTSEILTLKTSLSQFGLCPKDWDIIPQNDNFHVIKNKSEDDFYFVGKADRKKNDEMEWKFITLAGL
jgi:hypothetical protein